MAVGLPCQRKGLARLLPPTLGQNNLRTGPGATPCPEEIPGKQTL